MVPWQDALGNRLGTENLLRLKKSADRPAKDRSAPLIGQACRSVSLSLTYPPTRCRTKPPRGYSLADAASGCTHSNWSLPVRSSRNARRTKRGSSSKFPNILPFVVSCPAMGVDHSWPLAVKTKRPKRIGVGHVVFAVQHAIGLDLAAKQLLNVGLEPSEPFYSHEPAYAAVFADPLQRMRAVIEIARINPMRFMSERGTEPIQPMESCSSRLRRWRWRIQIRGVRLGANSQHQQRQYECAGEHESGYRARATFDRGSLSRNLKIMSARSPRPRFIKYWKLRAVIVIKIKPGVSEKR